MLLTNEQTYRKKQQIMTDTPLRQKFILIPIWYFTKYL